MAASGSGVDSRGILRGSCELPSCTCDGYDGGSEMKRCVHCQHPPGKHQNLSTSTSASTSSVGSSISSSLSATSTPSLTTTDSVFMSPVYQCCHPGCVEETPFDPNTGEQLSPYCDQHYTLAAQSYAQVQQNLASSSSPPPTLQWPGSTEFSSINPYSQPVSGMGPDASESDDEDMDSDTVRFPQRRIQSDSGPATQSPMTLSPSSYRFPPAFTQVSASHSLPASRLDGMMKPRKSKYREKTPSSAPPKARVQAWPLLTTAPPAPAPTPQLQPTTVVPSVPSVSRT